MLDVTGRGLLRRHGAETRLAHEGLGVWEANLHGHRLVWLVSAAGRMVSVVHATPEGGRPDDDLRAGPRLRRFIEVATARAWWVGDDRLEVGPDGLRGLRPSVRVAGRGMPWGLYKARLWEGEVLGVAGHVLAGEMPPEVFIDWLRDRGLLGGER